MPSVETRTDGAVISVCNASEVVEAWKICDVRCHQNGISPNPLSSAGGGGGGVVSTGAGTGRRGIGGAVRVGSLSGVNGGGKGVIAGASADAELAVGSSGKDFLVRPVLADGAGRLSFVKEGGGTAAIVSTNAYTGRTVVRGGTLRLRGSIFESPSLSWWLDASRPETVLCDANGGVTNWQSLVNGVSFVPVNNSARPTRSTLENGMGVVNFGADAHCGLATPTNVTQRTVFVVYRWAGAVSASTWSSGSATTTSARNRAR